MRVRAIAFSGLALAALAGLAVMRMSDAGRSAYRRPDQIPFPIDNPYTEPKRRLGEMLFYDTRLSGAQDLSCASCHLPAAAWSDHLKGAKGAGAKPLPLRTPTLLNVAWTEPLGWDGKFASLEAVTFAPITGAGNMNASEALVLTRLQASPDYVSAFQDAFGSPEITRPRVEAALATFERTIVAGEAPFDRFIAGDETAISPLARRGFDLFRDKALCATCHAGWNFSDGSFHDVGTGKADDIGRGRLFPTSEKLKFAFKTPSLRDVERRAPYMHDGSSATLADVIDLYNRGGVERPSRSEHIRPLRLSDDDKQALLAFLKTLTSDQPPRLPHATISAPATIPPLANATEVSSAD